MKKLVTQADAVFGAVAVNLDHNELEKIMNELTWKYVKPLASEDSIAEYEALADLSIPSDLKDEIRAHNGGRPSFKYYDLPGEKDKEFKSLLSFNHGDIENVFNCYPPDSNDRTITPFAIDPSGNLFVLKDGKIYLWNHEQDETLYLADTFLEFLGKLHE